MTRHAVFAAGWLLVVGSVWHGATVLSRGRDGGVLRRLVRVPTSLGARYERSRTGRRLAERLEDARLPMSPVRWRVAQVLVAAPLAAALGGVMGVGAAAALAVASTAVRLGGRVLLMSRRGRRDAAVSGGITHLCRAVAVEVDCGATVAAALDRALPGLVAAGHHEVEAMVRSALTRHRTGEAVDDALVRAVELARVGSRARRDLVAATTAVAVQRTCGTSTEALGRVASAIEQRLRSEREVAASIREPRTVAVAVPALAVIVAGALVTSDPASTTVLAAPLGALVAVGGAVVAGVGVVAVRAVTSA